MSPKQEQEKTVKKEKPRKEKRYTHHIKVDGERNGKQGKILILGHGKTPEEAKQKAEQAAQRQNISLTGAQREDKVKSGSGR